MYMKDYDSRTYSINDFVEWDERKQLQISPKFQRRSVWSPQAKSYLMDTVIRGKPLPKFFMRQITNPETKTTLREVVDGQQRMRAILNYLSDGFKISSVHNDQYGGYFYSELPIEVKGDILKYEVAVDLLLDLEDKDILDIFARLNTYSVSLNKQELFNAKYFGYFKQLVYKLGFEFSKFWSDNELFSNTKIMRMAEAELVSDLLATMIDGIHSKKGIEKYYVNYDEVFEDREIYESRFKETIDLIGDIFGGTLRETNYSRVPVFYGLFVSLYHMNYGVTGLDSERTEIKQNNYAKVRSMLSTIDNILNTEPVPAKFQNFYNSVTKATTDVPSRKARCEFISYNINNYIKN
jgi:hypothetical protein